MEQNKKAILEGLNEEQKEAVIAINGPILIVAGAGSGKTRVLTSRIAYMLESGVEPDKILSLTFTKKAATEMKERISIIVGDRRARRLYMGTFHSVFIRFLREFSDKIGYPSNFTIYDQSDSLSAIKTCIKELGVDDKIYKPKEILGRISMAKNNLVTAEAYRKNATIIMKDTYAKKPKLCDLYKLYADKCKNSGVMDYDDILLNMNILLRDFPEVLTEISSRFEYILVDEYQDTNKSQYLILKKLSERHHNICVVGDDSQSIYAFRGAKIENILNFKADYPNCLIVRLEKNYRSTQNIVNAANSLIAKNENRIPKKCISVSNEGEKILLINAYSEVEEGMYIVSEIIKRIQSEQAKYQDFAILYRTNAQSRVLEEALRKRNIPYMIYSGNSFFDRAEVKDMMAYFKLAVNVNDDESFKRIVNKPARGIGDTSLTALTEAAKTHNISYFKAAYLNDLETFGLKAAAIQKIKAFCEIINKAALMAITEDANTVVSYISKESGLYAFYKNDNSIEGQARAGNIEELINSVASFIESKEAELREEITDNEEKTIPVTTLPMFLEETSLLSNIDIDEREDSTNKVNLMTVHSAKGLEFPYVFVAGLEENLFPSGGILATENDIEEERRLFYVALTRAEKAVTLSFTQTRMRNGKHESNKPSRFIREIDKEYISNPLREEDDYENDSDSNGNTLKFSNSGINKLIRNSDYGRGRFGGSIYGKSGEVKFEKKTSFTNTSQLPPTSSIKENLRNRPLPPKIPDTEFIPVSMTEFKVGQRIEHNRFGCGSIVEISGVFPEMRAKIIFDEYGEKILMLKYAKIRFPK
ncbi:MAG: ATP-dependent helicase [Candidatus Cryptobacteroides sp.]